MAELPKDVIPTVEFGFSVEGKGIMNRFVTEAPATPSEKELPRTTKVVKQLKGHKVGFVNRLFVKMFFVQVSDTYSQGEL